jgi:hypothetical protein
MLTTMSRVESFGAAKKITGRRIKRRRKISKK